jgi:hypothetical protein
MLIRDKGKLNESIINGKLTTNDERKAKQILLAKVPPKRRFYKKKSLLFIRKIMLSGHVQVRSISCSALEHTQSLQNSHGAVEQAMG